MEKEQHGKCLWASDEQKEKYVNLFVCCLVFLSRFGDLIFFA